MTPPPETGLALEPVISFVSLWDQTGQLSALIPGDNLICLSFPLPALLPLSGSFPPNSQGPELSLTSEEPASSEGYLVVLEAPASA